MVEWIAEIGSNHKGSSSLAYRMVKEAAQAGATVIKFQAGRDPADPIRYADYFLPAAFEWCISWGVGFLASVWSWDGMNLCRELGMKRRKIAHQQAALDDDGTKFILGEKRETFISIDFNLPRNRAFYDTHFDNENLTWLYVSSKYPSYIYPQHRLYGKVFGMQGYSDHTHGIAAPLCAVAHGARVIECHFTLDPAEESIGDNHFACTPDEFATMVKLGNEIARLGD